MIPSTQQAEGTQPEASLGDLTRPSLHICKEGQGRGSEVSVCLARRGPGSILTHIKHPPQVCPCDDTLTAPQDVHRCEPCVFFYMVKGLCREAGVEDLVRLRFFWILQVNPGQEEGRERGSDEEAEEE